MLRKACSERRGSQGLSPTFCLLAASGPSALPSQPGRESTSVSKGAAISAQHRAADRTSIIQGRMNRWPSCHRGWGGSPLPHCCQRLRQTAC